MNSRAGSNFGRGAKRILDPIASVVALALLSLPFAAIALAIKLDDRAPVFFRQDRVGRGGRVFRVWKLRAVDVNALRPGRGSSLTTPYSPARPGRAPRHSSPKGADKRR